jgi:hypothetical protein
MRRKISFISAGIFALLGLFLLIGQILGMTGRVVGGVADFDYGILVAEGLFVVSLLLFQLNKRK